MSLIVKKKEGAPCEKSGLRLSQHKREMIFLIEEGTEDWGSFLSGKETYADDRIVRVRYV